MDPRGLWALRERPDSWAHKVLQVILDLKVLRVLLGLKVHKAAKVRPDRKVHRGLLDL
jgi:hypothetical protein